MKLKAQVPAVDEVVVIAQQLEEARNGIQTQTRHFDLHDQQRRSTPRPAATTLS